MQTKTIWYGAKNDQPAFADNQQALVSQGISNPKSFTVNGEVTGLNLITSEQNVHGQSSAQTQA